MHLVEVECRAVEIPSSGDTVAYEEYAVIRQEAEAAGIKCIFEDYFTIIIDITHQIVSIEDDGDECPRVCLYCLLEHIFLSWFCTSGMILGRSAVSQLVITIVKRQCEHTFRIVPPLAITHQCALRLVDIDPDRHGQVARTAIVEVAFRTKSIVIFAEIEHRMCRSIRSTCQLDSCQIVCRLGCRSFSECSCELDILFTHHECQDAIDDISSDIFAAECDCLEFISLSRGKRSDHFCAGLYLDAALDCFTCHGDCYRAVFRCCPCEC